MSSKSRPQGSTRNGLAGTIGVNIRQAREQRGWLQRQLANKLDMNAQHLSDWERGSYRPNDENLLRLAEVLEQSMAWFYTDHSAEQVARGLDDEAARALRVWADIRECFAAEPVCRSCAQHRPLVNGRCERCADRHEDMAHDASKYPEDS
jgi:transcriptional regulator with XRE-family HTH domain